MLLDCDQWREAARARGERFAEIRPACTFVQVARFIDPAWLVELELDARRGDDDPFRVRRRTIDGRMRASSS